MFVDKLADGKDADLLLHGLGRLERLAFVVFQAVLTCIAVLVGVAVGNGVPMARTASESLRVGMAAGARAAAADCPCNKNRGSVPAPTSLGQKLERKPDGTFALVDGAKLDPVPDGEAGKAPLFEGVKGVQPVAKGPTPLAEVPKAVQSP